MKDVAIPVCEAEIFVKEHYPMALECGYMKIDDGKFGVFIKSEHPGGIELSDRFPQQFGINDFDAAWENAKQHILNKTIPKP